MQHAWQCSTRGKPSNIIPKKCNKTTKNLEEKAIFGRQYTYIYTYAYIYFLIFTKAVQEASKSLPIKRQGNYAFQDACIIILSLALK